MKSILTLLALSCLLTGCSNRDAKLDKQIIGTWKTEGESSSVLTLSPDGIFSTHWRNGDLVGTYDGTWRIMDGVLVATITNATGAKHELVGTIDRMKITQLDANHLVYEFSGHTFTLSHQ